MNSLDLLKALKTLGHIHDERDPWWWPNSGSFDVVVGALLTQQTRWENVEQSLARLRRAGRLNLHALADASPDELRQHIRPSGFFNTKAQRLHTLARRIRHEFGNFDHFRQQVTRQWLLAQTGVGPETADSILCYACHRPVMVADAYSQRLLNALGIDARDYTAVQTWLAEGITNNPDAAHLYTPPISQVRIMARFHGKIVEYCKQNARGKHIDVTPLRSV